MKGTAIPLFTLVILSISILSCCLVLFFVTVTIVNRATTGTQRRSVEKSVKRQMHSSVLANYQGSKCIIQLSPLLAICFMTPLIAASAEKYVPLSIFIAGAGTLLTSRTVAKFSSQATRGGSLFAFVYQSLGPAIGIYCGILHIFALIFLTMGSSAFLSQFTSDLFTSINANSKESNWYVSPLFFVFLLQMSAGIVSIRGIGMATNTQLLVTFSSAGMCLVLGIVVVSNVHAVGLVSINSNRTVLTLPTTASPTIASPPPQFGHFCKSTLYSSLIFNGYESATAMSDGTKNSKFTTGQSVAYTIVASMVFYVLSSGLLSFGYATGHDWELDTSTIVTLSQHFMNRDVSRLYFIGVLIDGWVGSVALLNVISSLLHGLSYQGLPCQKLNLLHAISTPYVAVMCTVFLTLFLTTCAFYAVGFKIKSVFVFAADCGGVLAQAVYFLVMVGGHAEFQTFEPIVAATVALVAVFGATFGSGTVASGYLTAFSIIVLSGIGVCVVSVVRKMSPQTFIDGDTACQEDTEENVPLLLLQQEEKEKEEDRRQKTEANM